MKRLTRFQENISVRKATNYAIIINSLEILLILGVMTLVVISPQYDFSPRMMRLLVGVAAAVIIWGAVMDIREAMSTRRLLSQLDAMDDTIDAMEKLNNTLRAQRHDFLNHLQVVYSLMEMEEYGEANTYIEKVYGRITAVSRVLKTASAPINALLQVKLAACEKAGVQVTLNITSTWKELPISGWEMCKVLSNLIDNAIDAMADLPDGKKHLTITLTENLKEYVFSVANTGTPIPPDDQQRIFEPGVTTKSDGHGMGLFIVRETLRHYGGDIQVTKRRAGNGVLRHCAEGHDNSGSKSGTREQHKRIIIPLSSTELVRGLLWQVRQEMSVLHGKLGGKQGLRRSNKSCTRKEHESASNSIAKRGQGAIAPCRVKGQRPLWGLGQRPNCSAGDQHRKRTQQRRRQRSVPASNFARPQTRSQAALPPKIP